LHVMPKITNSASGIQKQPMTARKNSSSSSRIMHNNSLGG